MITAIDFTATEGRDESPLACEVRDAYALMEASMCRLQNAHEQWSESQRVISAAYRDAWRAARNYNNAVAEWLARDEATHGQG